MTASLEEKLSKGESAFVGEYKLIRLLGKGQSAHVYLAEREGLAQPAALKLIKNTGWTGALQSEAKTLRNLQTADCVVRLLDDQSADKNFIALEYLPVSLSPQSS